MKNFDFEGGSGYEVALHIEQIKLLHYCVLERIRLWEGSPARPAEEQTHLYQLRDTLYAMILDDTFHNS